MTASAVFVTMKGRFAAAAPLQSRDFYKRIVKDKFLLDGAKKVTYTPNLVRLSKLSKATVTEKGLNELI